MGHNYTNIQKLSLAGVVIGALLCIAGALSPYWIVSDPQGFDLVGTIVGKIVKGNLGLYMYCVEVKLLGEKNCEVFEIGDQGGWFHTSRVCGSACVLLAILSGSISLCLACCNCCKRFICLGILSFLAAVSGAACAIMFAKNTDVFTSTIADFKLSSYGWAFYLFCAGVGLLGLVSFTACFASPDNPIRGMVLGHAPSVMVSMENRTAVNNPYLNLQEEHMVGVNTNALQPGPMMVTNNGY
ncbi:uncharacterized protein [Littorina saxatilis]|uniref:Uncharacterized protein n=1 Tax=Littorina saxatilis TaxID=31220 RepID=A0AAN9C0M6_9CAEN